ncbi:hypothetical protein HDU89_001743 [Geranomyces variabilis]|nr:hypothetical protein HDU89_001743 [Geranomyces variabilis]
MPSAPSRSPSSPLGRLFHINGAVAAANSFLFHTQDDELPWPTAELLRGVHTPPYASRQENNNDGEDQDGDDDDDDDEEEPSYEDFDEPLAELAARADMTLVNSAGIAARSHRGFAGTADGSAGANDGAARNLTTTTTTAGESGNGGETTRSAAITNGTEADAEDAVRFLLSNPGPAFLRPHIDRDFVRRLRHIATRAQGEEDGDGEEDPVRLDHGFVDFGVEDDEDSDEEAEASDEEDEDDSDVDEDDDDDDEEKTEADLADLEAQFLSRGQSLHGRRRRRSSSASSTESISRSWLIDASLLDLVTQIHAPMNAGTTSSLSISSQPRRLLRRPAYRHYSPHSSLGLGAPPRHAAMGLPPRWPPLGTSGRRQWRDRVRDLRSSSGGGGGDSNNSNSSNNAGGPSSLSWLSLSPLSSTPPPSASDPSAVVCAVVSDVEKLFSERMDENGDFRCDTGAGPSGGGVELGRAWEVLGRLGRVDVDRDGQCGAHRRRMRKRRRDEAGARTRERVWHVGDAGR